MRGGNVGSLGNVGRFAEGDLLTVAQARTILPVSRTRMYELARSGEIPSIRVPSVGGGSGRLLILKAGLDDYIRSRVLDRPTVTEVTESPDDILARIEEESGQG